MEVKYVFDKLKEMNPNALMAIGFEDCVIGICNSHMGAILLYDENTIIKKLSTVFPENRLWSYYYYNVIGFNSSDYAPAYFIKTEVNKTALDELQIQNPLLIRIIDYDDCLIGTCNTYKGVVLLYSENKIIRKLRKTFSNDDAGQYYYYNILKHYNSKYAPIYFITLEEEHSKKEK